MRLRAKLAQALHQSPARKNPGEAPGQSEETSR